MNTLEYYSSFRPEVACHLKNIADGSRVLEVGCGTGHFKALLVAKELEYWGIEPYEEAALLAKTKLDRVLVGTYEKVQDDLPDNYFDYVICLDVIEHMEDPWSFFTLVRRKLKDSGNLISSIPNFRHIVNLGNLLIKKQFTYTEAGILDKTHLRFFTKNSILEIHETSSFSIEKIIGINKYNFNRRTPAMLLLSIAYPLLTIVFGSDVKFFQFLTIAVKRRDG